MKSARTSSVRSFALAFGLAVPALFAAACNLGEVPIGKDGDNITCIDDSDCPNGQVCNSQVCDTCDPEPEHCDGFDNDCDGVVDNDAICPNGGVCLMGQCCNAGACG